MPLRLAAAMAILQASSAMPVSTASTSGNATIEIRCMIGCQAPDGRRTEIAASGTKTSSNNTSCEAVPRMPIVSQVAIILMPGEGRGTAMCITVGPSGVCSTAIVMNKLADGAPLAKTLRPLTL